MLQIDHVYEFLYQEIFKDFLTYYLPNGGVLTDKKILNFNDINIFTPENIPTQKIFFHDQEPLIIPRSEEYIKLFDFPRSMDPENFCDLAEKKQLPYVIYEHSSSAAWYDIVAPILRKDPTFLKKQPSIIVTSEKSILLNLYLKKYSMHELYYFFHGFAALDWYRGHYALNYNKSIVKDYQHDYIAYNRIITNDRSYRIYFVSLLKARGLLDHGQVSFNVTDNLFDDWQDEVADTNSKLSIDARQHIEHHLTDISKLVIDHPELPGSASADIPRGNDAFWHVVTETVFYYNKLHLTEKIFKPIVSKQPFMLLAAPGNLAYLKSYGFKTFDSVIDESYDLIQDNDLRTQAVVNQLHWYCTLTPGEKTNIIQQLEPIIDYNFHHFYGEFRHIITRELLDNTKTVFKEIGYDDSQINYDSIYHVLTQ
jgi:hypothetical protein